MGRVIFKRLAGRKRKNWSDGDGDGEDEDYIVDEEEDDDESSSESGVSDWERVGVGEASSFGVPLREAKERANGMIKSRRGYSSRLQKSRVSDTEEDEDGDDYEDCMDDVDFSPEDEEEEDEDEDEENWEENSMASGYASSSRRGSVKLGEKKRKRKAPKPKAKKKSRKAAGTPAKKRRRVAGSDSDDDGFIFKGRASVRRPRKEPKKVSSRTVKAKSVRRKRSSNIAESFDPDYLIFDDDFVVKDRVSADIQRKKAQIRKKANSRRRKKKARRDSDTSDSDFVISDEDITVRNQALVIKQRRKNKSKRFLVELESSDLDDEILEEEITDLEIERVLNVNKPERNFAEMKGEDKGKEKEEDDSSKQLCGICLSEQQKGTVHGILNCCSHMFCFACILEWSKVESRCPLCKRRFVTIMKSSGSDPNSAMRRAVIRVQKRDQVYQPSEDELRVLLDPYENVVCLECQQGGDDSLMLLCDICDSSAHTYCVGLGREVPEGNWYCDCCRVAGEASLHSQTQETRAVSNSQVSSSIAETSSPRNLHSNTNFQGQSSSHGNDVNTLPRNLFAEDSHFSVSAPSPSGASASTLSGRRAIQQRIRILLSNNRSIQVNSIGDRIMCDLQTQAVAPVTEQNVGTLFASENSNSTCQMRTTEQQRENSRHFANSRSNLASCIFNQTRNFQHVEGAKEQIQSVVKHYLKKLTREIPLERSTFKKIARNTTHTILAACGIEHHRSMVYSLPFQPPKNCSHDSDGGPVNFVRGLCSSCFASYVKNVVKLFV